VSGRFNLNRPLRVLACIEARSVTGPAKNLLMLAQALSANTVRPCEIRIATFVRGETRNAFTEACARSGVQVDLIRERWRFDPGVLAQLGRVVGEYQPDIIQSHNVKSHFLIASSGLRGRVPWIAFNHGYTAEDLKMRVYNRLDRWSLPRAGRVVVVCRAFGDLMLSWGVAEDRIAVRHNSVAPAPCVDLNEVSELSYRLKIPAGHRVLLAVGRLSEEKAHIDLLRAVAELKRRGEDRFRLVVVGAGPELNRLETEAVALGIAGDTIFAGSAARVAPYYSLANVFILPSHSEGSPNVLLEAMASGVPVVATAVGGVPEIVQPGVNGLLVPPGEPQAMADGISRLLGSPGLRASLAAQAREWVAGRHSPEEHIEWMLNLYLGVLGQERAQASPSGAASGLH
jgi:glycosyltransferase involved in cell wall biosynthesis